MDWLALTGTALTQTTLSGKGLLATLYLRRGETIVASATVQRQDFLAVVDRGLVRVGGSSPEYTVTLRNPLPAMADLRAEIERLKMENAALKAENAVLRTQLQFSTEKE